MHANNIGKGRLEAFSDGVIAIILTIMVLNLNVPKPPTWENLLTLWPVVLSYVLSYLLVAIMWVNHHHLIHSARHVNSALLWLNIHLLFWMSFIPFATAAMGAGCGMPVPTALYGLDLTFCSLAFLLLLGELARQHSDDPHMCRVHRRALRKNVLAVLLYACSVPAAFYSVHISDAIFVLIPALYFLPEQALIPKHPE